MADPARQPNVAEVEDAFVAALHGDGDDIYISKDRLLIGEPLKAALADDEITAYAIGKLNDEKCALVIAERAGAVVARIENGVGEAFVLGPLRGVFRQRCRIEGQRTVETMVFDDERLQGLLELEAPLPPEPLPAYDRPAAARRREMATAIHGTLKVWAAAGMR